MTLGFSTNEVIVGCSQGDPQKLREDCNVTWMMHLSKTNQEQYGLRTLKHKQLLFCLKCVYLPASKCTRTPVYTSLAHLCLCLTKRLLAYHLHLFPMKFPKNAMDQRSLYQTFVAKEKFGILSMKHLKDRRDCVWST